MNGRISISPAICRGQACVSGTRVPVFQLLRMLACLDYAASLAAERVTPLEALIDKT